MLRRSSHKSLSAPPYQTGPLGNYYFTPWNNPLSGLGSRTVAQAGLCHYTTRTDQSPDSGSMVSIGLHYIITSSSTSATPLDTDADGIPDYVEDANGNGVFDVGTETDWQHNYSTTDPTTGQPVADAYSTIYDDIDLDGDGMVGRIEKALGKNPLVSDNPLTLPQVITGQEPDVVTFEVPIKYSTLAAIGTLNLNINEVDATMEEFEPASDGNCLLVWNTTFDPPGQHYLQAQLTIGGSVPDTAVVTAVGPTLPFNSANVLQFFGSDSMYDSSGVNLDAQLPAQYVGQNVNYTIQLYDPAFPSSPIKTKTGTTSSGMIQETWNLVEDNGNTFVGDSMDATFNVTSPSSAAGQASKRLAKLVNNVTGNTFDFTYMYTPVTSELASDFDKDGVIFTGMEGVVNFLTQPSYVWTPYNSVIDQYTWPGNTVGNPGYITSRSYVIETLLPDLENPNTRNFYCYAHGGAAGAGKILNNFNEDVYLGTFDVAPDLDNDLDPSLGLWEAANPYRFVFLDGCSTASTHAWANAFGIYPLDVPNQAGLSKVGPQAFVGWAKEFDGWLNGGTGDSVKDEDIAYAYTQTLNNFFDNWMSGLTLEQCIRYASVSAYNCAPLPVPGNETVTVTGILGTHEFSYAFKNFETSKIYVIGHSGLTRSGKNSSYDGFYAPPANTQ